MQPVVPIKTLTVLIAAWFVVDLIGYLLLLPGVVTLHNLIEDAFWQTGLWLVCWFSYSKPANNDCARPE